MSEPTSKNSKPSADAPSDDHAKDDVVTDKPTTDISLISGDNKPRQYKKDNSSFFMMRSYQILLVLAMIAIFLLVMVYQTLFGRIERPSQMVTIEQGETYYGLLPDWQRQIPLFSMSIAKIYIKSQVTEPLHAGTYQLPANPTLTEVLNILQQGSEAALIKVQIIEGKQAKDLYQTLRHTNGINIEVLGQAPLEPANEEQQGSQEAEPQDEQLTAHSQTEAPTQSKTEPQPDIQAKQDGVVDNTAIAEALGLAAQLPESVQTHTDPIANHNLEGWFAPDTYYYGEGSSDKQILTDLYNRQQQILTEAWANRDPDVPYQTPYEALIMASIIEKETGIADERPLVSAVFANRIKKGMRLQTDPTIIYGMGERYDGNIRRKDIDEKTVYNTYQIDGLPPTPIALPSKAAIEATLHPADSEALYFVATGHGGHKFSNTLAEHNEAVQAYLKVKRQQNADNN